mgnify:CR=1 FL=1
MMWNRKRIIRYTALLLVVAFAIPVMFVIADLSESREFSDTNVFTSDGYIDHYYIERYNTSLSAEIYIYHAEGTNMLTIETTNVELLLIDADSLYADEKDRVWYSAVDWETWIPSHPVYYINLTTDGNLSHVRFTKSENVVPVRVEWNGENQNYTVNGDVISSDIPVHISGSYNMVAIWYVTPNQILFGSLAQFMFTAGVIYVVIRWMRDMVLGGFGGTDGEFVGMKNGRF